MLWFQLAILTQLVSASQVKLSHGTFAGTQLSNGVTQWLGIPYAAKPIGDLRFAPPQDPPQLQGVQQANKEGPICLQTGATPANKGSASEDCLYLAVYAPTYAKPTSKLPVFIYIQGGGFNQNANPNLNGTGLIKAAKDNGLVVVTFNYRVGPWGFLASSSSSKGLPITNNGLLDQRKVFQWVQTNIAQFGGDPGHVTLGGASAGAASISLHLTAYGGRNDNLFHAAAAESVSFGVVNTASQAQYQYDHYTQLVGCSNSDPAKSLGCLRGKTTDQLLVQNINIPYPGQTKSPLYMFGPTIDGGLVTDLTYTAFAKGKFINVPVIFGADTNDGRSFAPKITSQSQSNEFLTRQFPALTSKQLSSLAALYPVPSGCSNDCWYQQLAAVYGDLRYMCPALYISSAYANVTTKRSRDMASIFIGGGSLLPRGTSSTAYAYRYNVEDPSQIKNGFGVPHTAEVAAIFGPDNVRSGPDSYKSGQSNSKSVSVVQSYWTSFIRHYDPNVERYPGSAQWQAYGSEPKQQPWRLLFESQGATRMEIISQDQRKKCAYAASIGPSIKQK